MFTSIRSNMVNILGYEIVHDKIFAAQNDFCVRFNQTKIKQDFC